MASGAVPQLRSLALLILAALYISCLQAATPAASQLSHPLPASATATPLVLEAAPGEQAAAAAEDGGACTYTVKVKTSCGSAARSSGAVSLAFGDAYRNEVYVARLTPRYGFERCATDTFRVSGPCGYGVCYLYLRGAGRDGGWAPEWVRVFEPTSSTPSTFYFGGPLPAGVWYGFDRCVSRPGPASAVVDGDEASSVAAAQSV